MLVFVGCVSIIASCIHIKWLGYEDPADDSWEPEGGLTRDGTVDNTVGV
jgi:hypothetical protein